LYRLDIHEYTQNNDAVCELLHYALILLSSTLPLDVSKLLRFPTDNHRLLI
jgi:hypothetical protein